MHCTSHSLYIADMLPTSQPYFSVHNGVSLAGHSLCGGVHRRHSDHGCVGVSAFADPGEGSGPP